MNNLAYLFAQTESQKIYNLKTGDLIKIKGDKPFVYHYGVIFEENGVLWLYHFHPDYKNKFGGNVLRDDFKKYIRGKDLVSVEKLNIEKDKIYETLDKYKYKKYDLFTNNCEHFVNFVKDQKPVSNQLKYWGLGLSLAIGCYLLIRKK